jgi:hypothetical protein
MQQQTRTKNTGRTRTRKTRKNKKVTLRVRRKRQQLKKTLKGGWFFGKKLSNYRTIIDVFYLPQHAQNDYKLPCYTGKLVLNVNPSDPDKDSLIDYARVNEYKNQKPTPIEGKFNIMSYLVNNYMGVRQKTKYNGKTENQVDYKKDIIPDVEYYTKVLKMDGIIDDNRNQLTKKCSTIDKINISGVTGVEKPEPVPERVPERVPEPDSLPPSSPSPSSPLPSSSFSP